MACCCVSNCGDNVTINTCCEDSGLGGDGTATNGEGDGTATGKSTLGSFSATSECSNGDLIVTITGFNPCGSYSATYDDVTFNDTDCVITIPSYSTVSPIVISVDTVQGTDTLTMSPTVCSLPNYALSVSCSTVENELSINWLNPNNETLYLYRQGSDGVYTLIYSGTDLSFMDSVVTWGNTYTYSLSKQNTATYIVASSLFDSSVCSPCNCTNIELYACDPIIVGVGALNTTTFTLTTKSENLSEPCNATLQGLDIFRLNDGGLVDTTKYTVVINNWFFTEVADGKGTISVVFTVSHVSPAVSYGYKLSDSIKACLD